MMLGRLIRLFSATSFVLKKNTGDIKNKNECFKAYISPNDSEVATNLRRQAEALAELKPKLLMGDSALLERLQRVKISA